jgi:multiple sugar transport system permease protein/putative aldouronate transport system permease protein
VKNKSSAIHISREDRILDVTIKVLIVLFIICVAYPMIYVVSSSFSSGKAVSQGSVFLWPVEPTLKGYRTVFAYRDVWTGYANTIFYTVVGTVINVIATTLCAYPLARRNLQFKKFYNILFLIPLFFSAGLVPSYILMTNLHLTNTRWAILLPGAISIYNMNIMRTYFQNSIPGDLLEAAKIDGITDFGYLLKIVLPLSRPIYAVITLYYAVGHWNSYFDALIYLRKDEMKPLQLVLRSILNASRIDLSSFTDPEVLAQLVGLSDLMRFSLVVVSSLPILVAYPFVQRYFEKGVMIGAVKG